LAKYRLAPEVRLLIQRRLSPPQIVDGEIRLKEIDRNTATLLDKQRELTQLVQQKLASPKNLEQINQDLNLIAQQRSVVQDRVRQERQYAKEDSAILNKQLGKDLSSGQIPPEVSLVAPIGGHVIWISPDLQTGAEMDPALGVFQIGVMNPMMVRAQVFEIEALQIKPGERAEVTLESLPGQKFQGEVNRISWSSLTPGLEQPAYYDVELKVPNPDLLLKDGLKARIVFRNHK
jgi:multidrug resistance efflux pump